MKNSLTFIILSLIILNIFLTNLNTSAEEIINPEEVLGFDEKGLENFADNPKDTSKEYLKKELGTIASKNAFFGPIINGYKKTTPFLDPISKALLGTETSLSWLYFLILTLWVWMIIYIYRGLDLFGLFEGWIKSLISLVIGILVSFTGAIEYISKEIVETVSLIKIWWVQLIIIIVIIVAFILLSVFSKKIEELTKKLKENQEQEKTEKARTLIQAEGEVSKTRLGLR